RRSVGVSVAGMKTQVVDQHWFVSLNGKRYGPYTFTALTEAAAKGFITAETHVWRLCWQQLHLATQVPGLLKRTTASPYTYEADEQTNGRLPEMEAERAISPSRQDRPPARDTIESPRELSLRRSQDEDASHDAPRLRVRRPSPEADAPAVQPQQGDRPPSEGE